MKHISVVALLLFLSLPCRAANTVGRIEHDAWFATNVVIATVGKQFDGKAVVLDSILGNLRVGEEINVPNLTRFEAAESRRVKCFIQFPALGDCPGSDPLTLSGSRVILLLRPAVAQTILPGWDLLTSLWFEDGHGYELFLYHSKPAHFIDTGASEDLVRNIVHKVSAQKRVLDDALRLENVMDRRRALEQFAAGIDSQTVFESDRLAYIAGATETAKREDTAFIFARLLSRELDYWKKTAPQLQVDKDRTQLTGIKLMMEISAERHTHFVNTSDILEALASLRHADDSKPVVHELRDSWLSDPILSDFYWIIEYSNVILNR